MSMAEINDAKISNALSSYYDSIGDEELTNLYQKYIGKRYQGEKLGDKTGLTDDMRSGMRGALKGRILPSVYNGGMILSEDAAKDTKGF
jgi:hypothetical protein